MSKTHISFLFFSPGFWELWQAEKIQATELTSGPCLQQTGVDGHALSSLVHVLGSYGQFELVRVRGRTCSGPP